MTDDEAIDLEELRRNIASEKRACYDYLAAIDRYSERDLLHAGYGGKTNADAMRDAFKRFAKRIKQLQDAHVKKYPD